MQPREMMSRAYEEHALVPAFNVAYLPMLPAIAEAVEELGCYALAEVAQPDVKLFGAGSLRAVAEVYFDLSNRERLGLHLDHAPVIDEQGKRVDWRAIISDALEIGYESVMVDGSRLPLDENISVAAEVANMAKPYDAPVEAELGAVLGHEAGPLPPYEELFESGRGFTDPAEAGRFVKESGVDWLSVAVGNIHGAISGAAKDQPKLQARLNIEHLQKLSDITRVPLVLHGGSGVPGEYLRQAADYGLTKINVGTEIRQAYEKAGGVSGDEKRGAEAVKTTIIELINERFRKVLRD